MRHAALIGAVVCTVCVTACSESPNISGIEGINIRSVEISPKLDTLFVADTLRPTDRLQMQAAVIGRGGEPISGAKVAWSTSKPEVAIVTEGGMVIPTGYGSTVISASASEVAKATIVVLPAARSVVITPAMDTIFVEDPIAVRDSIRLTAKALDENGDVITGVAFTWSSGLAATATVNVAGSVVARSLGVVNISARSGDNAGSATVRVASAVKSITVAAPVTTVLARDTLQISATALGYDDKPMAGRTFTWTSSNPTVATVDGNGRAIFLRSGNVTFTAKSALTTSAVTVTALERQFQSISSGDDYTCGFTNLGRGYCWGVGDAGQLATAADSTCFDDRITPLRGTPGASYACTISPKRFAGPAIEFTAIETGKLSACAISKDKMIYCWGASGDGRLGNGGRGGGAQAGLATVAQERFDSITVGGAHACALNLARRAYCWGSDSVGQLGDNRLVNSTTPIPVNGGLTFTTIAAGEAHTCGISSGQLYCWGGNVFGQLGTGAPSGLADEPIALGAGSSFVAISAGTNDTCALNSSGAAFCWGAHFGPSPQSIGGGSFTRISVGETHACAITAAGAAFCWGGDPEHGGVGSASATQTAAGVALKSISAGSNHTCGVALDGETYCWGSNVFGTLGNELQAAYRTTPERVAVPR